MSDPSALRTVQRSQFTRQRRAELGEIIRSCVIYRQDIADAAKCSKSTVKSALSGAMVAVSALAAIDRAIVGILEDRDRTRNRKLSRPDEIVFYQVPILTKEQLLGEPWGEP